MFGRSEGSDKTVWMCSSVCVKRPLFLTHCNYLFPGKGDEIVIAPTRSSIPSLRSCVKRPLFITHCIWLCLLQLRFYYFIGSLNTYLNRILDRDEQLGEGLCCTRVVRAGNFFQSPLVP